MPTTKNPQYMGYEYDISNWVIPLRNNILGLSFLTMTKELKYKKCNTVDDAENITSKSHGPRGLLMTPAQREERILAECTDVVPA